MTCPTPLRPPWITHVVTMLVMAAGWYVLTLERYGVSAEGGLWSPGDASAAAVLVLVAVVPGSILAWFEAEWVQVGRRWGSRLLAVCYVLPASLVAHFPADARFFGDASPTRLADLVLAWVTFPIMVGLQLMLVWWLMTRCPIPPERRREEPQAHADRVPRRLAKRLGLVE